MIIEIIIFSIVCLIILLMFIRINTLKRYNKKQVNVLIEKLKKENQDYKSKLQHFHAEQRNDIRLLTEEQGQQILEFVFPQKKYTYQGLSFDPVIDEDGRQQVSFSFRSLIGIKYHNGQDNCILHFDNSKVVLWLYSLRFEIKEYLESNSHYSELENDFENFVFAVENLPMSIDDFRESYKHNWYPNYVKDKIKELAEKYYYKDYK